MSGGTWTSQAAGRRLAPTSVLRFPWHPFARGLHLSYPPSAALNVGLRKNEAVTEAGQSSPTKEISRGAVAIAKEHIGRGPTKVRATITDGVVTILYEDGLTPAEKKLVMDGDPEFVRLMRRRFQDAVRPHIVSLVEGVLSRKARAFFSDHDVVRDIGIEVILLEEPGGPDSESDSA